MKRKLINLLRVIAVIAICILIFQGFNVLLLLQYASCPEVLSTNTLAAAITIGLVLLLLSMPIGACLVSRIGGWQLHTLHILFIQITKKDKLRVRFVPRLGSYAHMLPPRIDGTSPWVLRLFAVPIWCLALFVLLVLACLITWHTPIAPVFMILIGVSIGCACAYLLPSKGDVLPLMLHFRRDARCRQAFECAQHISAAGMDKQQLQDMPEAWFPALPAALLDDYFVRYITFQRSSWLIRNEREAEGYEALLPLLDLTPAPETYTTIAGAILNGAVVEALTDLPPRCLQLLDDPSVKYMTPASWDRAVKMALYARALFLHHNEAEAAALLPEVEKHIIPEREEPRRTLRRLQEKAGLIPKEDPHAP